MLSLTMLGTDLAILVITTTRVWLRLLPKVLTFYLIGWLGYQLSLKLAIAVGSVSPWLSLGVFSTGFIFRLAAIVLILRLIGQELRVRELIPDDEYEDDGRESSVARLLAITLLPFLGIYTAFGEVQKAAAQLQVESLFQGGGILSQENITSRLNTNSGTTKHYLTVVAVVAGAYVVRRLVDQIHEHTGWRPLGFLVALLEGFFVLSALIAGGGALRRLLGWLSDRVFVSWLERIGAAISGVWTAITSVLPDVVVSLFDTIRDNFWPVLLEVVTQPIIWLAVAALVYGSNVISVAELWRKGRPLASRVRVAQRVAARREGRPRVQRDHRRAKFVGLEIREAFLGDIDDKYLPTIHSVRLILRAGVIFLGAFVLVYNLQQIVKNYWEYATNALFGGGHPIAYWSTFGPALDLLRELPFEGWRICLLAVALHRALEIFRARAESQGRLYPDVGEPLTAGQAAGSGSGSGIGSAAVPDGRRGLPQPVGAARRAVGEVS